MYTNSGQFIIQHDDGRKEFMTHDFWLSSDPVVKKTKLASLRKLVKLDKVLVTCSCTNPQPIMSLCHITDSDSYYIRAISSKAHAKSCHYYGEGSERQSPGSIYERGFQKKENGLTEIKFDGQDYRLEKTEKMKKSNGGGTKTSAPLTSNGGISTNRPTVYATLWRLLTESWNRTIKLAYYEGQTYPTHGAEEVYNRFVNSTAKQYTLKDIPMNKLLYKGEKTGRISIIEDDYKSKSAAFTMLLLTDEDIELVGDMYFLSLRNPTKSTKQVLSVDANSFEKALKSIRGLSGPYFAGGFVKNMGYQKIPQFVSFALVPINSYGVPVESSYERILYTELCKQKRPFLKCLTSSYTSWNGFVPDGLLIDTTPKTIIEVFGMSESVEDYHIQRGIKIEHFSNLKPKFNLWYWDAYKGEKFDLSVLPQ